MFQYFILTFSNVFIALYSFSTRKKDGLGEGTVNGLDFFFLIATDLDERNIEWELLVWT